LVLPDSGQRCGGKGSEGGGGERTKGFTETWRGTKSYRKARVKLPKKRVGTYVDKYTQPGQKRFVAYIARGGSSRKKGGMGGGTVDQLQQKMLEARSKGSGTKRSMVMGMKGLKSGPIGTLVAGTRTNVEEEERDLK